MDSAEESRNSTDLPEKTAHLSESTVNVKAKRRQGVSDLHISPLALFSLGTLGSADPDWQFTHCASDSESGDSEDEGVSAFFSRYSHSPHSSVDSTSTSGSWHVHSECSSPTSSGPPATPTSPTVRPLSIKKRNTAMGPLPSPGRFASSGPSLSRSATLSSPPRSSSLPPRSPSPPSSPSTPSPSPRRTVESEEQVAADDEFYAVQARGFVTLAQSESARKSSIFPSTSTSTSTAQNVPVRPRRPPPPPPPLVDAALCSFSPSAASTPSSHLRNSHVHTNSASYPRARIATSDAHARPRSSSTSTSSSYSSYSTSSTTGQAVLSSVCFPSSYTAPAPLAASRSRSPSASRPRTGRVPNFSRPTSLALGLLVGSSEPTSSSVPPTCSPPPSHAPFEYPNEAFPPFDAFAGGESDGNVDLADFDFAADYAAYAPLLRTPTPSPGVGMGYGIGIGATAPWGAHVHGEDENEWVAYTEETGHMYIEGGGDEQQQQELSPLVAPAPSPAPLSESEPEYSPDEDDSDEHGGDWRPLASAPASGSGSSCSSLSYGAPLLAPSPQPPRVPAEPAPPTPALRSRWSSSTISSSIPHTAARVPRRPSPSGATSPARAPLRTPSPSPLPVLHRAPWVASPSCPPPPRRLRTPDYAESSRLSSGSVSAGWSYAAASAQRSVASSPPSAVGHHSAQSSVSGHSARDSVSEAVGWSEAANSRSHIPLSFTL
ncbi:hypothetical protein B0H14DRAFT_3869337 [Mycena olivaceomarginata]|nr:hypothetical protein B0H14DRAFT_3869337 [Mycena olivaceomarginata]